MASRTIETPSIEKWEIIIKRMPLNLSFDAFMAG
jgi:hypothetical protein